MATITESIRKVLPGVAQNTPLRTWSRIGIGGPAEYYALSHSADDLKKSILIAQMLGLRYTVLGGLTKSLIADKGLQGLVMRLVHTNLMFHQKCVEVDSGYHLTRLALQAAQKSLSGLEFAVGIPGTVGGAVLMNAGCFGSNMKNVVESVRSIDVRGRIHERSNDECQFGYRTSIFQYAQEVVLSVRLRLESGREDAIRKQYQSNLLFRKTHQPITLLTLGSTFCNVDPEVLSDELISRYNLRSAIRDGAIGAGAIIDACGLKGFQIGGAEIYSGHANFIINHGTATAEHVMMLISIIKQRVRLLFGGLQLKDEVRFIGFDT